MAGKFNQVLVGHRKLLINGVDISPSVTMVDVSPVIESGRRRVRLELFTDDVTIEPEVEYC